MSDKTAQPGSPDDEDEPVSGTSDSPEFGVKPAARPSGSSAGADLAEESDSADTADPETTPAAESDSPAANSDAAPTAGNESDSGEGAAPDVGDPGGPGRLKKVLDGGLDNDAEKTRQRSSLPRAVLIGLVAAVALLIGAIGTAGYLFVQERDKAALLAAHDEVRDAACAYAPVLATYDANDLDPYFQDVLAGATGDWKQEFETTTGELREALVAGQVVSTAGDIQCAVKSAEENSAEVVVVIGQTITSLGTEGQPAPGQLAAVMRMQKTGDRWLVDQMSTPLSGAPVTTG